VKPAAPPVQADLSCFDELIAELVKWREHDLASRIEDWDVVDRFQRSTAGPLRRCLVWLDAHGYDRLAARLESTYDDLSRSILELHEQAEAGVLTGCQPFSAAVDLSNTKLADAVELVHDIRRVLASRVSAQTESTPAPPSSDQPAQALLRVFTNGIADERIMQAAAILTNNKISANEKLIKIDALIPLPATASANQLGDLLGVSRQAILKSEWWMRHRRGDQEIKVGRRRDVHRERARSYEAQSCDDD
jgi:hypothetical protein